MGDAAYDSLAYAWRFLFVLALLFAALFLVRRRWRGGGHGLSVRRYMRVVETLALGPQRHVHVVAVGDRQYLIGATTQSVTFLASLDHPTLKPDDSGSSDNEDEARAAESEPDFGAFLKQAGVPKKDASK